MVTLYSMPKCPGCMSTVKFFERHDIKFKKIDLTEDEDGKKEFSKLGLTSAPVVYVNEGNYWAGFNLAKLNTLLAH